MIRDREVEGELCLKLSMLQRGLIEGCFNAVRKMAGWNNHSYLFTQQTPQLTFNDCSMCGGSRLSGGFDFHCRLEKIHLISSAFFSWYT